ncbi:MAG: dihydrodipicolinate synthase family protein [Burkholderiales bacterium]
MAQPFTLIAAAFTPFAADGSLDRSKIAVQRDRLVADGVDGAFICGTTGEGASLTTEERMAVTAAWTAGATTGFKVIAHVGHASAQEGAKLARHAESVGAQAFATVAPYFLKPRNAREVVDALAVVAAGAPSLPFYYYHVPLATGVNVPAAAVVAEARSRIPNFRGVKFTDDDLNDLGQVIESCGNDLEVFYGRDDLLLPAMSLGVRQAVGMTYNYTGPLARRLVAAFDRGDLASARQAQAPLRRLVGASLPHGIINALKSVAPAVGIDCGPCRPPLTTLTETETRAFLAATGIESALGTPAARLAA